MRQGDAGAGKCRCETYVSSVFPARVEAWPSDCQIFGTQFGVVQHLFGGAVKHHAAGIKDHRTIREFKRTHRVLFDDEWW